MASLIENLIGTLEEECSLYEQLTAVSLEKTPVIVANDLSKLSEINAKEQALVDQITSVSHKRDQELVDIATVLSKDAKTITVSEIIGLIKKQPEFQHPLIAIRDKLIKQVEQLHQVSVHNQELLKEAIEMTEYSINLVQSLNQAPETANYSGANYSGSTLGASYSSFDTKQ